MEQRNIKIGNFELANNRPLALLAGPCQIESTQHAIDMAERWLKSPKNLA